MANDYNKFNPCFFPHIKPARIMSRYTGGYYHSSSEAPFGKFLSDHGKLHIDFDKDTVEYAYDPSVVQLTRYTPDFNMYFGKNEDGAIIADLIDVKAKAPSEDPAVAMLANNVKRGILGNTHEFKSKKIYPRSFVIATASGLYYFDDIVDDPNGIPAMIYKCPKCGKVEILPEHRLTCTKCGHNFEIDDAFCAPSDAMVQYTRRDAIKTELTDKFRSHFLDRCREYNIDVVDMSNRDLAAKKQMFRIELPEFPSQYYEADFAYICQDASVHSYNNTPELQAHVGIITSAQDKELIEALVRHAADKETPIDAFVFVTPNGMYITERWHGAKMRPAHFATCPKCGKGYIASDEFPECPHCH